MYAKMLNSWKGIYCGTHSGKSSEVVWKYFSQGNQKVLRNFRKANPRPHVKGLPEENS